jgi:hypothetical protein
MDIENHDHELDGEADAKILLQLRLPMNWNAIVIIAFIITTIAMKRRLNSI